VAAVDDAQALLERNAALDRIDQRLRDAIAGAGSLLLLEGPAGIGKTRLVLEARRRGRELGLQALSARGSELEQDFAHGLVRQLFEAPVLAASSPARAELLAGAAGRAAALFGVAGPDDDAADALLDPSFAILHGLYWLCANLARRSALLLCVDDVHWADQASLRFLHYLGRRLQELPIAVVAAARPAESREGSQLLAALAADPTAEVVVLAPERARGGRARGAGARHDSRIGFRESVPRDDRRCSVPHPGARPHDRWGGHRADRRSRLQGPGARAGNRLAVRRAARESAFSSRPRAGTSGGRARRGRPSARGRPCRRRPRSRRNRGRRARGGRDPRAGSAASLRAPDRPGGGGGRSLVRRAGWPTRGGGAAARVRGRVCGPDRSPPSRDRSGRGRLGGRFAADGGEDGYRERRSGLGRRLSASGAGGGPVPSASR
jgi:AAA ATPase domain